MSSIVSRTYFGNPRRDTISRTFLMSPSFSCGESSITEYNLVIYESIVSIVGTSLVPGSTKFANACTRAVRRLLRWLSNTMLAFRCWFVSISIFSIACFKLSTCLEVSEFCSSNSVAALRSCLSSSSRTERIRLRRVHKAFEWWRLHLLYHEEWGSISVSGQLPTYPSPNPTTVYW